MLGQLIVAKLVEKIVSKIQENLAHRVMCVLL